MAAFDAAHEWGTYAENLQRLVGHRLDRLEFSEQVRPEGEGAIARRGGEQHPTRYPGSSKSIPCGCPQSYQPAAAMSEQGVRGRIRALFLECREEVMQPGLKGL